MMYFPISYAKTKMINEYEGYYSIKKGLAKLNTMTYKELVEFKEEFTQFQSRVMAENKTMYDAGAYGPPKPMFKYMEQLDELIQEKSNSNYYLPEKTIHTEANEEVNGYKLYKAEEIMKEDVFVELSKIWNDGDGEYSDKDKFMEVYDEKACNEWAKQDEYGESFGGYWKFPEGTNERENAYSLTRKKNGECLINLPYEICSSYYRYRLFQ